MAVYENNGQFDLDLRSSGDGWCGTFAMLVRTAAKDILSDGEPFGPVEVVWTIDNGSALIDGTLIRANDLEIEVQKNGAGPCIIEIDDVRRFRA